MLVKTFIQENEDTVWGKKNSVLIVVDADNDSE